MATEKQIAANRLNAQKSTGPRTEAGKRISASNGRLNELFAATIPMRGESAERFTELVGRLISEHQPQTDGQISLVHRLAVTTWRQMRLWGIESCVLSNEVDAQVAANPNLAAKDPLQQAAAAYLSLGTQSQFSRTFNRDETRLNREFYSAWRTLHQAKKEKNGNPINVRQAP